MVHHLARWHACATGRFGRCGSELRFMAVTFLMTVLDIADNVPKIWYWLEQRRIGIRVRGTIRILILISSRYIGNHNL